MGSMCFILTISIEMTVGNNSLSVLSFCRSILCLRNSYIVQSISKQKLVGPITIKEKATGWDSRNEEKFVRLSLPYPFDVVKDHQTLVTQLGSMVI